MLVSGGEWSVGSWCCLVLVVYGADDWCWWYVALVSVDADGCYW